MPTPTPGLLNRPLMTMTLRLIGSSGLSDRLNVIPASAPFAHQWLPLMPLPMNSTANRFGTGSLALEAPAQAGSDSIHGNATVAPIPRRTVRLETLIYPRAFARGAPRSPLRSGGRACGAPNP